MEVPGGPEAPVIGKVTHHSVELSWQPPDHAPSTGKLCYCVQEEEVGKGRGFMNVYNGYATHHEFTGLSALTQYNYRLRAVSDVEPGPWSPEATVTTTRQPRTCENMHKAIQRGDVELVRTILEARYLNSSSGFHCPHFIDVPDNFGTAPLMSACRLGRTDIVELLLDLGANVEYKTSSGKTSLMEACYHGQLECVKLVIGGGASWLTRDHSGFSALHWAVDGGHVSVVSYALSEGVPVDEMDSSTVSGWTPLMRTAAVGGNATVARVLVEHGANVNRRDSEGKTVMMLAALNGFEEVVRLLLASGADPLSKNEYGKTALDFAESFQRQEVAELLQAAIHMSTEDKPE